MNQPHLRMWRVEPDHLVCSRPARAQQTRPHRPSSFVGISALLPVLWPP